MVKTSSNKYQPGLFDVVLDVCELTKDLNKESFTKMVLDNLIKDWRENFGSVVHPCPYSGKIEAKWFLTCVNDANWLEITESKKDTRSYVTFINGQNNEVMGEIMYGDSYK